MPDPDWYANRLQSYAEIISVSRALLVDYRDSIESDTDGRKEKIERVIDRIDGFRGYRPE